MTEIFVFGSNLAGRHGKGAAKHALINHGAIYGQGWGLQGTSFGIPTKDANLKTLDLRYVEHYVRLFKIFAAGHPLYQFNVTPIGCGLAGYKPEQIAPFFAGSPANVSLPPEFLKVLNEAKSRNPNPS